MNSQEYSSFEAETSVLGSVLLDSSVMDEIASLLEPKDFYKEEHQLIWKAMRHKWDNAQPIDLVTMTETFMQYKRLEEVGGVVYLTELANSVPSVANAKHYVEIIKEKSLRRKMLLASEKIRKLAIESEDVNDAVSELELITTMIGSGQDRSLRDIFSVREDYFEYIQRKQDTVLTGLKSFDEWSGGIGRGWLYILAGRPSVGKTAKALQMAMGIARQDAGDVLIWSQEMSYYQVLDRMICNVAQLNYNRVRRKVLDDRELAKARKAYDWLQNLPIRVDDASGVSIQEIRSMARHVKRQKGRVGAIVVDYLGIMDITQRQNQNRAQAIGEVTRIAKQVARELECPFILLAQMSRDGAKVSEPELHHLKESGDIEQDADVVEFLYEDEEITDIQNGTGVISKIAKGREIGVRKFNYRFKGWWQRYESAE